MNMHASGAGWAVLDVPLPATAKTIRGEARAFARREIEPRAAEIDAAGKFPDDLWPKLGQAGLLGLTVAPEYGGAGLGYLEHLVVMEEISRASTAVGFSYLVHSHACVNQIALYGTQEQKRRLLPGLVNGSQVGGLAMTEPDAGSDVFGGMRTVAEPAGDGFRLSGRKAWIANAPRADVLVVYARTDPDLGSKGISAFVVDTRRPGVTPGPARASLGMRGCQVGDIAFDGCHLGADDLLGGLNQGAAVLMEGLARERLVATGGALGLLQACLDVALPYCCLREQFGKPIASFQLVQAKLADMLADLNASRSYAYAMAAVHGNGQGHSFDSTALLLFVAERASAAARQAVQLMGAAGFDAESSASRLYRDASLFTLGFGTSEIRRIVVGRGLLSASQARHN